MWPMSFEKFCFIVFKVLAEGNQRSRIINNMSKQTIDYTQNCEGKTILYKLIIAEVRLNIKSNLDIGKSPFFLVSVWFQIHISNELKQYQF